ncbi:leucine-rich repeat-containing protein 52-like [Tiliqua scincoides]|uniref:leucine-rich repeat-containing protein 52-like n=1 Tax=Tiliqua scincoides TaxID=71010 RepID=UPI00346228D3
MRYFVLTAFHISTPLWLALLIGLRWPEKSLGCPPECTCENWEVNCTGKNLRSIPTTIPLPTKKLNLADNNLTCLPQLEISYLNELIYLDCSHNQLNMNYPFSFPDMTQLTYLDLSYNNISYITAYTFRQLNKLLFLNLSGNRSLKEIKDKSFGGNTMLRYLDLSNCGLTYLSGDLVKHLHNLHQVGVNGNPWHCDCDFLEFCAWMKESLYRHAFDSIDRDLLWSKLASMGIDKRLLMLIKILYSNTSYASDVICHKPESLYGLTLFEAENTLHFECLTHLEKNDFIFMTLIAFCIFFGGTLVAGLVGISTVIYYHPVVKMHDDSEDEEQKMI